MSKDTTPVIVCREKGKEEENNEIQKERESTDNERKTQKCLIST